MTVAVGADIGRASGDIPGMRQGGTTITGCRDWFRLVLFKIERLERASSE